MRSRSLDRPSGELEVTDADRAAASRYAAVIEWSDLDGVYVVTVPDIPNLHTHGTTREAAATAVDEVIALWIAGAHETDLPVPPPRFRALPPAEFDAARVAALRRRLNLTQHEFARLLNVSAVRGWEQGLRSPDGASQRLLGIGERDPEVQLRDAGPVRFNAQRDDRGRS
jgi:predicted RNase H-like HicB family nuclease